jgi:SAM-dependent methyltransferase
MDRGFESELAFWDQELSLKGSFTDDILNRLDPQRMERVFPHSIRGLLEELSNTFGSIPRVLDLGSGPLSMLAHGVRQKWLHLTAVDPLADEYRHLLTKYGYEPNCELIRAHGEDLSSVFGANQFELIWINNALDHTRSPGQVLREMVKVVRPGGYLYIQGFTREGTAEGWNGLHQHDLYLLPGPTLACESRYQPNWPTMVEHITEGLPIIPVEWTEPTQIVKSWMKLVCRKSDALAISGRSVTSSSKAL